MPRKLTAEETEAREIKRAEAYKAKVEKHRKNSERIAAKRFCSCGTLLLVPELAQGHVKCARCRVWAKSKENFAPLENWIRSLT